MIFLNVKYACVTCVTLFAKTSPSQGARRFQITNIHNLKLYPLGRDVGRRLRLPVKYPQNPNSLVSIGSFWAAAEKAFVWTHQDPSHSVTFILAPLSMQGTPLPIHWYGPSNATSRDWLMILGYLLPAHCPPCSKHLCAGVPRHFRICCAYHDLEMLTRGSLLMFRMPRRTVVVRLRALLKRAI